MANPAAMPREYQFVGLPNYDLIPPGNRFWGPFGIGVTAFLAGFGILIIVGLVALSCTLLNNFRCPLMDLRKWAIYGGCILGGGAVIAFLTWGGENLYRAIQRYRWEHNALPVQQKEMEQR